MTNKKFEIVNIKGKKFRKERGIGNLVGGFASILCALSIASVGLNMAMQSLQSRKSLSAREVTRV